MLAAALEGLRAELEFDRPRFFLVAGTDSRGRAPNAKQRRGKDDPFYHRRRPDAYSRAAVYAEAVEEVRESASRHNRERLARRLLASVSGKQPFHAQG